MSDTSTQKIVGWKEIAKHLDTSVRTAQRWEQELGLPIHHAGSTKGYTVFAYSGELESWLKGSSRDAIGTSDRPQPEVSTELRTQSARWRFLGSVAAAVILVVVAGSILVVVKFGAFHSSNIGSITFSGRQMLAWSNGKVVWSYDFGQPTRNLPAEDLSRKVHIMPSDGYGRGQVIVAAPLLVPENGDVSTDAVYRFSGRGKVLWRHDFADRIHFGGEECGPRWEVQALMVTGEGPNWSAWCTICSYPTSVSMVVKIDPSGNTTRYFVNYGHLGKLNELRVPGGPYLLAGGMNNENDNGALAVLDETRSSGHSPQTGAFSDCESCPLGQPYRYFLFPRSEVIRVTGPPYNGVRDLVVTNAQIQVMTGEGVGEGYERGIWALYDISAALVPQSVFFSDYYWFAHEKLSAEGKINHSVSACPERLKPITVRTWSPQEGWKNILVPPVESKIPN
jgi:hypothetical protein